MPIRMEDDPQDNESSPSESGGGGMGNGGGGGMFQLLPLILLLFRSPKLLLIIAILVGGYYFFGRGCNANILQNVSQLKTGGFLDPRQFEKASIYEPLAEDNEKNPLPESANLQKYAPAVGDQGHQGSCVAWSSAYGARTIVEAIRTGQDPNRVKFSPSFLYNQIGLQGCDGSYVEKAMEFMTTMGSVPYDEFPYTDQDCSKQPGRDLLNEAAKLRMRGFNRLSKGDRNNVLDLRAIKENLAQGAPVVIGMMVGGSYMQPMLGQDVWNPTDEDRSLEGFGGHAQCVVGYDDTKYGGAFLIMNSWGPQWGNNGFAWVRYPDFKYFVREAYGLEGMAKVGEAVNTAFECEIGLVSVSVNGNKTSTGGYIPLRNRSGNIFETINPLQPGSKFKMEIKNTSECYIYVFGKETDGTSYTLFPYPTAEDPSQTKYSPYCGIAGYRMFPRDKHMTPDSLGHKDFMAVVVSRDSLNWSSINRKISQNPQEDYASRINQALGDNLIRDIQFDATQKGTMHFKLDPNKNGIVACIVEINKP